MGEKITEFIWVVFLWSIILALIGFPVMWLWNWLCPDIFGLPEISFWKTIGLIALLSILGRVIGIDKKI